MEVGGDVSLITAHSGLQQTKIVQKLTIIIKDHIIWEKHNVFEKSLTLDLTTRIGMGRYVCVNIVTPSVIISELK